MTSLAASLDLDEASDGLGLLFLFLLGYLLVQEGLEHASNGFQMFGLLGCRLSKLILFEPELVFSGSKVLCWKEALAG